MIRRSVKFSSTIQFGRALAALLLAGCFSPVWAQGETAAPPAAKDSDVMRQMSRSFQDLVKRVSPSVVEVLVTGYGSPSDEDEKASTSVGRERALGSGIIIDSDGYIITNYHVVKGADRVRVAFTSPISDESQAEGLLKAHSRILPARVIGVSKMIDLAVLKVEATGLPTLSIGPYRQVQKGEIVLAFGSPEGLENSVAFGLVSSVLRQQSPDDQMVYIQTDAAINPGNSGGPLVDVDGNVVGIDTFIYTKSGGNEGLGFAIPGGIVRFAYEEIRKYGRVRRRAIGADLQSVSADLAGGLGLSSDSGVIISDVVPGGPADHAGLQTGDVIVTLDGLPVRNVPLFTLGLYVLNSGGSANLEVMRGDKKIEASVEVIEPRNDPQRLSELADPAKGLISRLGIIGVTVTADVAEFLGGLRMPSGVAVASMVSNELAVDSGLSEGDVIHTFNRTRITTVEDLRTAFANLKPGEPGAMLVERSGKLTYVTFEME
ncbi:MAG: trypsin-like peptidase domain-containing protein [Candidatus Acidiferrales bacterium]